jgi:hypothetical protein
MKGNESSEDAQARSWGDFVLKPGPLSSSCSYPLRISFLLALVCLFVMFYSLFMTSPHVFFNYLSFSRARTAGDMRGWKKNRICSKSGSGCCRDERSDDAPVTAS